MQWRISWKKVGLFWVTLLLIIGGIVVMGASGAVDFTGGDIVSTGTGNTVLAVIGCLVMFVGCILGLIGTYKTMQAFGHGFGWLILFIIFPNIMLLVLGFGSSAYLGPQD